MDKQSLEIPTCKCCNQRIPYLNHQTTTVAQQSQDSPVCSNTDDHPIPVSFKVTPSSTIAAHTGDHPIDDENSPLPSCGLQNVFTETVLSGSGDEDEDVEFSYRTETFLHSSSSQAGPHGFLGDALISLMSHHQFGFTRDFLCDVDAHFKM